MLNWILLRSIDQLQEVKENSHKKACIIFKHSTRCSISTVAKNRLEQSWNFETEEFETYYIDVIAFREVSNAAANEFGVIHESPQLLLIRDGKCTYDASHLDITVNALRNNNQSPLPTTL